jgi:hypothetical protein
LIIDKHWNREGAGWRFTGAVLVPRPEYGRPVPVV